MASPINNQRLSAFNRIGQYASITDNRAYCYAELTVSSLAVAEPIASILTAPIHGRMDRLNRPGWLVKYQDGVLTRLDVE